MTNSQNIISTAVDWIGSGRKVALATITQVSGSSPRPIGSQMIIDSDARFQGSVSGGCVETAVIEEAREVIETGIPKTMFFSGNEIDETWEVGLACGGSMEVYIVPAVPMLDMLKEIERMQSEQIACGYLTRIGGGDTILLVKENEAEIEKAPAAVRDMIRKNWTADHSRRIPAGDETYFWSQYCPSPQLVIIGAVHIAQPLVKIAETVGYKTAVIDPRGAFATEERFPGTQLIIEYPDDGLKQLSIHSSTAIVVLSHDPKIDDPALEVALRSKAFYVGALGSKKTHAARVERLSAAGFTQEEIGLINGPIGLDIGGKSIQEISVSIMAQVVQKKNRRG